MSAPNKSFHRLSRFFSLTRPLLFTLTQTSSETEFRATSDSKTIKRTHPFYIYFLVDFIFAYGLAWAPMNALVPENRGVSPSDEVTSSATRQR